MALDRSGSASKGALAACPPPLSPLPLFPTTFPGFPLPKGLIPLPAATPSSPPPIPAGKALLEGGMRARPFPLGDPPHPHPSSAPPRSCPVPLPARFLTPKPFPAGGLKKAFWGGFFWGGRFYSTSPWAEPSCPTKPPPCPEHFPWDFIFGVIFWGGFFVTISKWPFKFSTSSLRLRGSFQILVFTCFIWGQTETHRNEPVKCSLYTVLRSFSEGREIFP